LAAKHDDPKLSARNYKITIRLVVGGCSVHLVQLYAALRCPARAVGLLSVAEDVPFSWHNDFMAPSPPSFPSNEEPALSLSLSPSLSMCNFFSALLPVLTEISFAYFGRLVCRRTLWCIRRPTREWSRRERYLTPSPSSRLCLLHHLHARTFGISLFHGGPLSSNTRATPRVLCPETAASSTRPPRRARAGK
jgi:hypothetical protein